MFTARWPPSSTRATSSFPPWPRNTRRTRVTSATRLSWRTVSSDARPASTFSVHTLMCVCAEEAVLLKSTKVPRLMRRCRSVTFNLLPFFLMSRPLNYRQGSARCSSLSNGTENCVKFQKWDAIRDHFCNQIKNHLEEEILLMRRRWQDVFLKNAFDRPGELSLGKW